MNNSEMIAFLEESISSLREDVDALNGIITSCDAIMEQIRSAIAEADD